MQVRAEESACGVTLWGCNAAAVCSDWATATKFRGVDGAGSEDERSVIGDGHKREKGSGGSRQG